MIATGRVVGLVEVIIDDHKLMSCNAFIFLGWTALHISVNESHFQFTTLLLEYGANVNSRTESTGWTPLHAAAKNDDVKLVKLLLQHGANKNFEASKKDIGNHLRPADCAISQEVKQILQ